MVLVASSDILALLGESQLQTRNDIIYGTNTCDMNYFRKVLGSRTEKAFPPLNKAKEARNAVSRDSDNIILFNKL